MFDAASFFHEFPILNSSFLFICFLAVVISFAIYHGVFTNLNICTRSPPFKEIIVAYKFTRDVNKSKLLLSEVQKLAPELTTFGCFHPDKLSEDASDMAASVGAILQNGDWVAEERLCEKLVGYGYKFMTFPAVNTVIMATVPYRNRLSAYVACQKFYPQINRFMTVRNLCAHPVLEVYQQKEMHFIAPLYKQYDFYAPEAVPISQPSERYFCDRHDREVRQQNGRMVGFFSAFAS